MSLVLESPGGLLISQRLAEETLRQLQPFDPRALPVEPDLARRRGERIAVELRFERFELPGLGELRWTLMTSAKADIIALMIFPNDPSLLPIFASEFVVLGGRCKAAVVDLQSVAPRAVDRLAHADVMAGLGMEYGAWRSPNLPEWCAAHFTPHAIAALAVDLEDLDELLVGFGRYLALWTTLAQAAPWRDPAPSHELDEYKDHHVENTPGRPMMTAAFGGDWTERFLRQGMYLRGAQH